MDTQDIKHLMFDLKAIDNTLRGAKKTTQRSLDVWDDEESLRKKISYLEDLLSDVSDDLDRARDDLNKVMDRLDGQVYLIEMVELSKRVWSK